MNKWLKRAALAAVVLALVFGVGRAFVARKAKNEQAQLAADALRAPAVYTLTSRDVVVAHTAALQQGIAVSGAIRAVNTATIKAKVAGELMGLSVREGDSVRAGQVLGHVDTAEYEARVRQARQQAQSAAAQVDIAQRQMTNNQALVGQGFISATALDTAASNLNAAQATHRAALAALDIAQKSLSDTQLHSPISGQVASRTMQNGERVAIDARVLDVVDLSALELEAAVPPADAAQLKVGQVASLSVEGMPAPIQATVARISPAAQAASRSVMVYLRVPAAPGLRHGLFAQGEVRVGERTGVVIPATSVRNDQPQPYVQVVRAAVAASGASPAPAPGESRIAHVPVKVLAAGTLAQAPGNPEGHAPEPMVIVDSIAENSILLSGTAGFMQENTAVKVDTPTAARS
jgi:RND family efflux transporter MFP subunit